VDERGTVDVEGGFYGWYISWYRIFVVRIFNDCGVYVGLENKWIIIGLADSVFSLVLTVDDDAVGFDGVLFFDGKSKSSSLSSDGIVIFCFRIGGIVGIVGIVFGFCWSFWYRWLNGSSSSSVLSPNISFSFLGEIMLVFGSSNSSCSRRGEDRWC
jgi:hypothetical protein